MATLICQQCGKSVEIEQWRLNKGQKFCSIQCAGAAIKGKPRPNLRPGKTTLTCLQCGEEFEVWTAWVKRGRRKFCSWDCKIEYQKTLTGEKSTRYGIKHTEEAREKMRQAPRPTGKDVHTWKGGRFEDKHGYQYVQVANLKPESRALAEPMMMKSGYVLEHRLIMALSLGRPLKAAEKVHHINGNKADNRMENLQVFPVGGHSRKHREIDRLLSQLQKENETLKAENERLKSLLATYQTSG